jgi:hypothetical protein
LTKTPEKEPAYMEGVLKLVKKLSNEVVDLKRTSEEETSNHKPF